VEVNPDFYNEQSGDQYGFQINASSQAIDAGAAYAGDYAHPAIPVGASTIFANLDEYPTVDFFGNSLSGDSTPNIGASNAKNGEVVLSNLSKISAKEIQLQNPIVSDKVALYGVDESFKYYLIDLVGRTQQEGYLEENQSEILLKQSISTGVYILKIENKQSTFSGKLLVL
jgi:hypothetical protein